MVSSSDPAALVSRAARIRDEVEDLDAVERRVLAAWPQPTRPLEETAAFLDSAALNMHGFYSGIERMLELVARCLDGTTPSGQMWHHDLLR